jgi:hypothetical protein
MNLADLSTKLQARITGDTGSGGLYNATTQLVNAVYFDVTIGGATAPYIVLSFIAADEAGTFPKDAVNVTVDFEMVFDRRAGTFSEESTVLDRHRYLFHRWKPTLGGTYTATEMRRVTGQTQHDEQYRRYVERYEVRVEWNTKGPLT